MKRDSSCSQLERNSLQKTSNENTALIASRKAANILFNQLKPDLSIAEVITPSTNSIQKTLKNLILIRDKAMRDNLILECISEHATVQSDIKKAFISSNTKEFGSEEARLALRKSGVIYFSNINSLISWIDPQS